MRNRRSTHSILARVFTILAVLLLYTGAIGAQSRVIRFSKTSLTAREALEQIQAQMNYGVAFNSRTFDVDRVVRLSSYELSFDSAMNQILAGNDLTYTISNNIISIVKKEPVQEKKDEDKKYTRNYDSYTSYRPINNTPIAVKEQPKQEPVIEKVPDPIITYPDPVSYVEPIYQYAHTQGLLPKIGLKTNLLYGLGTLTPNLALEIGLSEKTSLELFGSYNPWRLKGSMESNRKLVHMVLRPEFRYWLCERYNGHFFGAHGIFAKYNIGSYEVPLLFEKEYRYYGIAAGGGITYGYQWILGDRWGLELAVGVGALWMKYDRYSCTYCSREFEPFTKFYFGPTNAAINLVFLIK